MLKSQSQDAVKAVTMTVAPDTDKPKVEVKQLAVVKEQVAEELLGVAALRHSVAGNVLQRKREIP